MKRGCSARAWPRGLRDRGSQSQATGLGRQGRREGSPVQTGKVLVKWLRRPEGPEAASAGLALAQEVRTPVPGRSNQVQGFQSPVMHFRPPGGPTTPPHLQSLPTSTPPRSHNRTHSQPHTLHIRRGLGRPWTHTLDPGMSLDWQPKGQVHGRRRCQGSGSSASLLIGCLTGIYPIAVHVHWF